MSIKTLLDYMDKPNLVPMIKKRDDGDDMLKKIGTMVVAQEQKNVESMKDWTETIERAMDLAKPEIISASYPWDGAANFKSPIITEAVREFGDRCKMEIMSRKDLVSTELTAMETPELKESISRIDTHMNYQLNTEMRNWREEQSRSFYWLASQGSIFKKTYYDSSEGCNKSEFIRHPNFTIDQECSCLEDSKFTETKVYTDNDIWEFEKMGLWDIDEKLKPKGDATEIKEEDFEFLEQHCRYDIDKDGYKEPYIITVHKGTASVVRIVPLWDVEGIHVQYNGATYNLMDLIESRVKPLAGQTQDEEFNRNAVEKEQKEIISKSQMVRIVPVEMISHYRFIESPEGSFLGVGYLHLLSSTVKGVNKGTNSLYNAGDLSNLQGGFLSKRFRPKKKGQVKFKPGEWIQTELEDPTTGIMPLPIKEPSQVLHALVSEIKLEAKEMTAKFNAGDALQPNIPASTVLGMLQEGVIPTSSLMMNVINAMSNEFQILFKLNQTYTDPVQYQKITDSQVNFIQDYGNEGLDIKPTANAKFSSQTQKIQLAEAQLAQAPLVQQFGGNPIPIVKYYYEAIESPILDLIFPDEIPPEQQKLLEEQKQLQQQQAEQMERQNNLLEHQARSLVMSAEAKQLDAQTKAEQAQVDNAVKIEKTEAEINKMEAETILAAEKAESEDKNNETNNYVRAVEAEAKLESARDKGAS